MLMTPEPTLAVITLAADGRVLTPTPTLPDKERASTW